MMQMKIQDMEKRLKVHFPDADVVVQDLTGTEDHWEVSVSSRLFAGLSRVEQHQSVMKAFADELKTGEVHALAIRTNLKKG
jgi:stress-induced morphogen